MVNDCCGNFVGGHPFDRPDRCPLAKARMDLAHEEALREYDGFELAEAELQIIALKAQRDGANNRVVYLERFIREAALKSGVGS